MYKLVLASKSPRRKMILSEAGFKFSTDSVKVSEIIDESLNLDEAIQILAQDKAKAYIQAHKEIVGEPIVVLSADTVVVHKGDVLGKPASLDEADEFLRRLSGELHCVKT